MEKCISFDFRSIEEFVFSTFEKCVWEELEEQLKWLHILFHSGLRCVSTSSPKHSYLFFFFLVFLVPFFHLLAMIFSSHQHLLKWFVSLTILHVYKVKVWMNASVHACACVRALRTFFKFPSCTQICQCVSALLLSYRASIIYIFVMAQRKEHLIPLCNINFCHFKFIDMHDKWFKSLVLYLHLDAEIVTCDGYDGRVFLSFSLFFM